MHHAAIGRQPDGGGILGLKESTRKAIRHTRNNAIAYVLLAAFFAYVVAYVVTFQPDVVFEVQFEYLPLVERYHRGELTFAELWRAWGPHRLLGYRLLFLANALLLRLNVVVEVLLVAVALLVSGAAIYWRYRPSLTACSPRAMQISFVIPAFFVFTLNQWGGIGSGMVVGMAIGSALFVLAFASIDAHLNDPKPARYAGAAFVAVFAILTFGAAYSAAFALAVIATLVARWTIERRGIGMIAAFGIPVVLSMAIYVAPIGSDPGLQSSPLPPVEGAGPKALQYFLLSCVSSAFGQNVVAQSKSLVPFVVLGAFLVAVYGFAIWAFVANGLYRTTYLPLFLILYALGFNALIAYSRGPWFTPDTAFYSWHVLHTKFGLVGIAWISIHAWATGRERGIQTRHAAFAFAVAPSISILAMLTGSAWTNVVEWKRAAWRGAYLARLVELARFGGPQLLDSNDATTPFIASKGDTLRGLAILRKYKLNVFRDWKGIEAESADAGSDLGSAKFVDGWYAPEGESRWISRRASALMRSGPDGILFVKGFVPPSIYERIYSRDIELSIFDGERLLAKSALPGGPFEVVAKVGPRKLVQLRLQLSKSYVPHDVGLGADKRELAVIVSALTLR